MRATLLRQATHYKPMIKFLGPRKNIEHAPHAPAPHPCAPGEIVDSFQSFLAKLQSSSDGPESPSSNPKAQTPEDSKHGKVLDSGSGSSGSGSGSGSSSGKSASAGSGSGKPVDFENFWEAPGYLWTPKEATEREIDAVMSGGATDIRTGP
ncbi:hypothetical protein I317_01415 [Kwoniella heveanensis CBS 569]|uniref:Uncharacterized protein n=1 Tax=Kwoniella heveanensis BCC8398 TaxID=1296120 RepID=A0A1B9GKF1_9TREE|nr:hypothetical protein I316_06899 [Kwoniella heveanensis BCC8398]OCF44726.1 hypothetical protein I317_01415 [Kwoniella heveanensis CBS 569]